MYLYIYIHLHSYSLFNIDTEDNSICLFVKSSDKKEIEVFFAENPLVGLSKVLSIDDVRKYYTTYKDKKKLLLEYTHFLCDSNVMPQLYNLLGKTFSNRNNLPIPITWRSVNKLSKSVIDAVSCTYMNMKG